MPRESSSEILIHHLAFIDDPRMTYPRPIPFSPSLPLPIVPPSLRRFPGVPPLAQRSAFLPYIFFASLIWCEDPPSSTKRSFPSTCIAKSSIWQRGRNVPNDHNTNHRDPDLSPHAWGCSGRRIGRFEGVKVVPTRVGMFRRAVGCSSPAKGCSHMRGDATRFEDD